MEVRSVDRGSNPSTAVASDINKRHNFSVIEFSRETEAIGDKNIKRLILRSWLM